MADRGAIGIGRIVCGKRSLGTTTDRKGIPTVSMGYAPRPLLRGPASYSVITKVNGVIAPNHPVELYDRETGELLDRVTSDASGVAVFTGLIAAVARYRVVMTPLAGDGGPYNAAVLDALTAT